MEASLNRWHVVRRNGHLGGMPARARLRELLVPLAGALAACSIAFPMDSYRGHPGGAMDADVPEGGDGGQAGIDAGDGGPPSFTLHCNELSPIPKFCDDFERTSVIGSWSLVNTALGGSVTLDTNDSRSPSRSLLCSSPGGPGFEEAWLRRSFPEVAA